MGPDFLPLSKASPFYSRIAVRDSAKWASNYVSIADFEILARAAG